MKAKDLINKVLYEEEEKNLKLFYKLDIMIEGEKPEEPPQEEPTPETPPPEVPPVEQPPPPETPPANPMESTIITEDVYRDKAEGEVVVSKDRVDNIQTLEDLIEFLVETKEDGKPVINDLIAEIILTTAGVGTSALQDIVNKSDKIFIDMDYGEDKGNSVGLRLNKTTGSNTISVAMKKNNNLLANEFDIKEFNKQLVFLRNSLIGEKE